MNSPGPKGQLCRCPASLIGTDAASATGGSAGFVGLRSATVLTLLERTNLTPKERTVVMLGFGLNGSHEYCRQLVQRALSKLRKTGIDDGFVEVY